MFGFSAEHLGEGVRKVRRWVRTSLQLKKPINEPTGSMSLSYAKLHGCVCGGLPTPVESVPSFYQILKRLPKQAGSNLSLSR